MTRRRPESTKPSSSRDRPRRTTWSVRLLRRLEVIFNELDTDRDGVLSKAEFRAFMEAAGTDAPAILKATSTAAAATKSDAAPGESKEEPAADPKTPEGKKVPLLSTVKTKIAEVISTPLNTVRGAVGTIATQLTPRLSTHGTREVQTAPRGGSEKSKASAPSSSSVGTAAAAAACSSSSKAARRRRTLPRRHLAAYVSSEGIR